MLSPPNITVFETPGYIFEFFVPINTADLSLLPVDAVSDVLSMTLISSICE